MDSSGHEFRQALGQLVSAPQCLGPQLGRPQCWGRFNDGGLRSSRGILTHKSGQSCWNLIRAVGGISLHLVSARSWHGARVPRNTFPREQDRNLFFMTCVWKSYDVTSVVVTGPPRFRGKGHKTSQWEASMPHCRRNMWDGRS